MKEAIRFHEWMVKIGSKYIGDDERMNNAYIIVIENE